MDKKLAPTHPTLGSSLVIGGCGFFGFHLVRHLVDDGGCTVHVLDRNVENNRVSGATYDQGSISNSQTVHCLLSHLRPRVIFHAASPPASLPAHLKTEFYKTNVKGTEILLAEATACDSVEALVFTSTVDVYAEPPHDNADETFPLWSMTSSKTTEYCRTKAIADRLVCRANGNRLRTLCLRLGHMYGERSTQGLYEILEAIKGNVPLVQIGPGENLMEVVSAENAATAHILAAKALIDPGCHTDPLGRVDGEAFNVSDGQPVPFWHHVRVIWAVARGKSALEKVIVMPVWLMTMIVFFAEWGFWIFSFGTVEPPPALTSASLSYCTETHTYSTEKARRRLEFMPIADHDEVLAKSVQWELNKRGAAQ